MTARARRTLTGGLFAAGLLGLLAFGLTRDPYDLPSPLVGGAAPEFALAVMPERPLPELDGWEGRDTARLSQLRGAPVVLNFWASWCLACREEHPVLSAAADRYRDEGVLFFGVLYQDKPPAARRFIRELGGQSYPTLLDPGSRVAIDYGVYGVPETYFLTAEGRVAHKHIGPVTPEVLRSRIDSLLIRSTGEAGAGETRGADEGRPPVGES